MPMPTPTIHRVTALVLLIGCLVLLADHTARSELAVAVGAPWQGGMYSVAFAADLRN